MAQAHQGDCSGLCCPAGWNPIGAGRTGRPITPVLTRASAAIAGVMSFGCVRPVWAASRRIAGGALSTILLGTILPTGPLFRFIPNETTGRNRQDCCWAPSTVVGRPSLLVKGPRQVPQVDRMAHHCRRQPGRPGKTQPTASCRHSLRLRRCGVGFSYAGAVQVAAALSNRPRGDPTSGLRALPTDHRLSLDRAPSKLDKCRAVLEYSNTPWIRSPWWTPPECCDRHRSHPGCSKATRSFAGPWSKLGGCSRRWNCPTPI